MYQLHWWYRGLKDLLPLNQLHLNLTKVLGVKASEGLDGGLEFWSKRNAKEKHVEMLYEM